MRKNTSMARGMDGTALPSKSANHKSDGGKVFCVRLSTDNPFHAEVSGYRKPVYSGGVVDREASGLEFDETQPDWS